MCCVNRDVILIIQYVNRNFNSFVLTLVSFAVKIYIGICILRGNEAKMEKFECLGEQKTAEVAAEFAKKLVPGDVVALKGELGAGKTAFTKGVAKFFGINPEDISSPTFTIVNEYNGSLDLFHFDAYRLENVDIDDCDWLDDYLFGDGVCIIEWAQNIEKVLPRGYYEVSIEKNPEKGLDYREIYIEKKINN